MWSSGYGDQSRGEGHLDSANYLVGVVHGFQCAAGVQAPTPRAYWHFSRGGAAPYSKPQHAEPDRQFRLRHQLGVYPPNLQSPVGQYP